jgi:hypothetical protein
MQYYSFDKYVDKKDLNEGLWDKIKGWGKSLIPQDIEQARQGGWPIQDGGQQPQPKAAARVLNPTMMNRYTRQSTRPTEDERAYGAKLYGGIASQAKDAQAQKPGRIKFSAQDVMEIKREIGEYTGMFKAFLRKMQRYLGTQAVQDYEENVKPYYDELKSWRGYIDQMILSLPKRESAEEMDDLVTEAVRVSHKDFARMLGSIKNLTTASQQWLQRISQQAKENPEFVDWAKNLFNTTIGNAQRRIDTVGQWIKQKLQDLMTAHGQEYQEPTRGGMAPTFRPMQ